MRIVTHNGKFHTDDVFAVGTLLLVYPASEVIRTRDEKVILTADIAVDVGRIYDPGKLRFDHHQIGGAGERAGIPYASFGLVWKEYGEKLAGREAAAVIEERLVMGVDALDNGVSIAEPRYPGIKEYGISDYLNSYWIDESVSEDELMVIFKRVVSLAGNLIKREIQKINRIIEEGKQVELIYNQSQDKRIIILDKHLAWGRILVEKPEPLVAVYPRLDSTNWGAQMVRKTLNGFDTRISFPKDWVGKTGLELAEISGVKDAVFCHNAGFLAIAKSREGAIALANKALNS